MENGGPASHDASKKVKGCKRHVAVDVERIPLAIRVHAAGVQDRDGVAEVNPAMLEKAPTVTRL